MNKQDKNGATRGNAPWKTSPDVTDPVATDPVVTDPVVTDPVVAEPVDPEPVEPPASDSVFAAVASHEINDGWGKVYLSVTNPGTDVVPLWETELPVPTGLTINAVWGGALTSVNDGVATIRAAEWTLDLAPGATQTLGLSYVFDAANPPAEDAWVVMRTASVSISPEAPETGSDGGEPVVADPVPVTVSASVKAHQANDGWGKVDIAVSNTGDAVVPMWEAKVPVPEGVFINSLWGGQLVSVEDGIATIRGAHWTDDLAAGQTQTMGLSYTLTGGGKLAADAWVVSSTAAVTFGPPPVMTTVNGVATYRIEVGTASKDIQAVLDGAPAGAEVVFADGTHIITQSLKISRDDLTVRGESADGVVLQGVYDKDAAGPLLQVEGSLNWWPQYSLKAAVKAGDTSVTFSAPLVAEVGDLVYLRQPNTEEYLDSIGDTQWRATTHSPLREVVSAITAIDGNVITLENSIDIDLSAADTQAFVVSAINGVAVHDLTMEYKLGDIAPGTYNNVLGSSFNLVPTLKVYGGNDVTVSNVTLNNNLSLGMTIDTSAGVRVDGLTVKDAYNQGNDGNGYGLMLQQTFNNTITDLSVEGMRHSILFSSHDTEGNNMIHARFLDRDINFHGGPDYSNTIVVDRMEFDRSLKDVWNLGVWYNEDGWHGGAPTGVEANDVRFREAITWKNHDLLFGHDDGSMLDGGPGNDTLIGGMGDDFLYGGEGDDILVSGAGRNVLEGGPGNDTFIIGGNSNGSRIADFTPSEDRIVLADGTEVVNQSKTDDHTHQIVLNDGSTWEITTTQPIGDLFGMN